MIFCLGSFTHSDTVTMVTVQMLAAVTMVMVQTLSLDIKTDEKIIYKPNSLNIKESTLCVTCGGLLNGLDWLDSGSLAASRCDCGVRWWTPPPEEEEGAGLPGACRSSSFWTRLREIACRVA